jgi:hypothetical protein
VVEQDRVDALVPAGALADQGPAQPDLGTRVGDVRRWHPRLGQGAGAQELAQVAGVGAVGLGPPLGAAQRPGVGRLGQVGAAPGTLQFLGDEPPAGVASNAKSACWPVNRASQARSSRRVAGLSCPRQVSPLSVSIQS